MDCPLLGYCATHISPARAQPASIPGHRLTSSNGDSCTLQAGVPDGGRSTPAAWARHGPPQSRTVPSSDAEAQRCGRRREWLTLHTLQHSRQSSAPVRRDPQPATDRCASCHILPHTTGTLLGASCYQEALLSRLTSVPHGRPPPPPYGLSLGPAASARHHSPPLRGPLTVRRQLLQSARSSQRNTAPPSSQHSQVLDHLALPGSLKAARHNISCRLATLQLPGPTNVTSKPHLSPHPAGLGSRPGC